MSGSLQIRVVSRRDTAAFDAYLASLQAAVSDTEPSVNEAVGVIVNDVRQRGLASLLEYTVRFDGVRLDAQTIEVTPEERRAVAARAPKQAVRALRAAAGRIRAYQRKLLPKGWMRTAGDETLGQLVLPMERVGVYVPGGKAVYPSSVLMNVIPAKLAGVREVIMVTPPGRDGIEPLVLAAAEIAGVDRVFRVGGAQAIAALAYGAGLPKVDKIVGPGNKYVAAAKQMVFGAVSIDMIAGPSEILVLADDSANPDWVAVDLLSQAEHDEDAVARLITWSAGVVEAVRAALERHLARIPRSHIARTALARRGAMIEVVTAEEAVELANRFAPEHLEICARNPEELLAGVRHAGAVFLGHHTPEAVGDYVAGPNHVLPTGGTARFSSPLGPYDFVKRTSVVRFGPKALERQAHTITMLADAEGLTAHGDSVRIRTITGG